MADVAVRDEAIRWFVLRQSGDMTLDELAAFDGWLSGSHQARAAYLQVERAWDVTGDLADDPEIVETRRADTRRHAFAVRARAAVAGLTTLAAALLIAVAPGRLALDLVRPSASGSERVLSTGPNRRALAKLPDGTVVTLDVGTRLRVLEMGERRRIQLLAGHAFFRVAKDALHPFLVTAMDKTVHAIGTAFDVRIAGDAVAVTLVEGKVRVDQSRGFLRAPIVATMVPGRQLVASDDKAWRMASVDTAKATSWLEDRLTYLPDTVAKVVADVNAGSPRKISFVGPIDGDTQIVGVFQRGDVESVVTALEMEGIAHVVSRSDDRIEMARDDRRVAL